MDDSSWTWPAWKFDMKRDDLFTKLHHQYNTYASPIQDSEAFYHDISEISYQAQSTSEFHLLACDRKQQRLDELNKSLESASFEIIGNPNLIKTPQWEHAIQLFRTRSLDSLVRYFASYLPPDHIWHTLSQESAINYADNGHTYRLQGEDCKNSERDEAIALEGEALPSLLTTGQSLEVNEPSQLARRSVLGMSSEQEINNNILQGDNTHVGWDEDAVSSGDDTSMTSHPVTAEHQSQRLSTVSFPKEATCKSHHARAQKGRSVVCRVSPKPITLTSSPADLLHPTPLQAVAPSDGSLQIVAGGLVGLKRKRPSAIEGIGSQQNWSQKKALVQKE
ncbi:uncharacterized protein B0J16DRAFT_351607 [Fusarium flagelliforme]|uniref:Uncharacterized protein n=1 Tax=Fusarium flagelliforme TaxID=2675880 RepID=A0A395M7X9_9HYPO|nr:uncharacterized protein B0J16DRAFT_351607 [Fusarium flagelliforme]KAH7169818.1 hypothetical protein B0J16DRAFT_351607 [Fusarium flagelliforme]RFN44007.1 hypothetical protein FIE12Z_11757 [Fusarium flagelliforme]